MLSKRAHSYMLVGQQGVRLVKWWAQVFSTGMKSMADSHPERHC